MSNQIDHLIQQLSSYKWKYPYSSSTSTGDCSLDLNSNGSLSASTGGNSLGCSWSLKATESTESTENTPFYLSCNHMFSTMMFPPLEVREREHFLSSLLAREKIPFTLVISDDTSKSAHLTLSTPQDGASSQGDKVVFQGTLTTEARGISVKTTFYDVWPVFVESQFLRFDFRSVEYDSNFVKSTTSDWAEYKNEIKGLVPDKEHQVRVRCLEYDEKSQNGTIETIRTKDMIVSTASIKF